jgi:hypothetical protein
MLGEAAIGVYFPYGRRIFQILILSDFVNS